MFSIGRVEMLFVSEVMRSLVPFSRTAPQDVGGRSLSVMGSGVNGQCGDRNSKCRVLPKSLKREGERIARGKCSLQGVRMFVD